MTVTSAAPPSIGEEPVTLAEAAELLDVHYMTAYRYVRTGRMIAEKRDGKWWVSPADLAAVIAEGTGARRNPSATPGPRAFHVDAFISRLVSGDTAGCWNMISGSLSSGATPVEIHLHLISKAMDEIGDRWSKGELSVAEEHRATATAYRLLGQMGPLFRRRGRRRGTVVLGSVSNDMHALPTAIMADLLFARQFDVIDLGAHVPTESFVNVATGIDDLVGIGISLAVDHVIESGLAQTSELRAALPDAFIVVGGSAIARSRRAEEFAVHADSVSITSDDVVAAFERACAAQGDGPAVDSTQLPDTE